MTQQQAPAAQDRLHQALSPWGIGAVTPTFLSGPSVGGAQHRAAYTATDYDRLTTIRTAWDPDYTFRINHTL